MTKLFENVGIAGLGLIGGSIARAIRQNHPEIKITGYTSSAKSSELALRLGIIDEIATSPLKIAKDCDLIIICTPLCAYKGILEKIAPHLNNGCILSDAGSLKTPFIKLAEKYLTKEQLRFVVPAHPIAGTEKTGVESGFATLFSDKKLIITPNKKTYSWAIAKIETLWQSFGSKIIVMEAERHDKIYANVSHLPQFLAYCYAMILCDNQQIFNQNKHNKINELFWKFSRICASDHLIWLDIFAMNLKNISPALEIFLQNIKNLPQDNACAEVVLNPAPDEYFNALFADIPTAMASALYNCGVVYEEYAGSGFIDFTSIKTLNYKKTSASEELLAALISKCRELVGLFENGEYQKAGNLIKNAADFYRDMRKFISD